MKENIANEKQYVYNQRPIDTNIFVSQVIFYSSECVSVGGKKIGLMGFVAPIKQEKEEAIKQLRKSLDSRMIKLLSNRIGLKGLHGYFSLPNACKLFEVAKETS